MRGTGVGPPLVPVTINGYWYKVKLKAEIKQIVSRLLYYIPDYSGLLYYKLL